MPAAPSAARNTQNQLNKTINNRNHERREWQQEQRGEKWFLLGKDGVEDMSEKQQ